MIFQFSVTILGILAKMRNRCFSQKGQRQGPNRAASQRALWLCVKMWYTNGLVQNIALLFPFRLTVDIYLILWIQLQFLNEIHWPLAAAFSFTTGQECNSIYMHRVFIFISIQTSKQASIFMLR